MAKDRFSLNTKNQPSTPSFAPNTLNVVQHSPFNMLDDEEGDICPVCDGECTCNNKPRVLPQGPLSMSQLQSLHLSSPPPPPLPAQKLPKPSLKIKLTVPQSLLGKRRNSNLSRISDNVNHLANDHLVAADSSDADSASGKQGTHPPSTSYTQPVHQYSRHQKLPPSKQRKGRPPKQLSAAAATPIPTSRQLSLSQTPRTSPLADASARTFQTQKKKLTSTKKQPKKQIPPRRLPASLVKKKAAAAAAKRRRLACSGDSSPLSDVDHRFGISDDEDDARSGHFPTFVSASILSSRASSSSASEDDDDDDLSSLSSFSDSSIEAEEENFIRSEVLHDRARVKRELLGDEGAHTRDSSWIIQPRKQSVGPEDVAMDVDTDATEDDDDARGLANADDEDEEDEEETDGQRRRYIGFGTGWSDDEEDEESSFDADIFFANLSDDGNSSSSSDHDDDIDGEDGDQSDMESMSASIASLTGPNFELTEGWDGQIMFTNGLRDGQGILDMDFEARAAQYIGTSPPASQILETASSDVEMNGLADDEDDDGGYERDTGEGEGDTTDEELVGDDDLPNDRAMRLFNLPLSVSSINPMSTMSPIAGPGARGRRQSTSLRAHTKTLESPKPADILSGKIFWDDSDDFDDFEDSTVRSRSLSSSGRPGPRRGNFEVIQEPRRQVIIDDSHKDIPSPHPRFRRRRTSSLVPFSSIEHVLQQHARTVAHSPSVSISSQASIASLPPTSEDIDSETPGAEHAELVDLNELLEASFMAPDPSSDSPSTSTENESRKAARTFNRWDVVSVGAFRQSRESGSGMGDVTVTPGGWASDTTGSKHNTDYGSMMKSSPLSAMLWNNKTNRANNRSRRPNITISPLLFPLKDGDRTPTNVPPPHQQQHTPPNQNKYYPHKSRKELKKERKLKRKNFGNHPPHYHHHNHSHHPNSKTRSSSSMQRNNSFTSIPPLSI